MSRMVLHFFNEVLLKSNGMFSFTISTSISQCFPTIQAGSIALFVAVTYLPSPNLYFVSLLNILIFLILFFNKHDLWIHKPMFSCNCFCVGRIDDCGWCRFHQKDFLFRYIFCHQDNITFFCFRVFFYNVYILRASKRACFCPL